MVLDEANEAASNSSTHSNRFRRRLEFLNMDSEADSISGGRQPAGWENQHGQETGPQLTKMGVIPKKHPEGCLSSTAARGWRETRGDIRRPVPREVPGSQPGPLWILFQVRARRRQVSGSRVVPGRGLHRPPLRVPGIWIFYYLGMGRDNCHADYGCEGWTEQIISRNSATS